jgi:hypothetical protein
MFYVKSQGRKGLSPDEHLMTVRAHERQMFRFDVPSRVCAHEDPFFFPKFAGIHVSCICILVYLFLL